VEAVLKVLPFFSTLLGGWLSLRAERWLHVIYGLCGGVMIGLIAFHLLPLVAVMGAPEVFSVPVPYVMVAVAFLLFYFIEEVVGHDELSTGPIESYANPTAGILGGIVLVGYSFVDGLAIGLGLQMSMMAGIAIVIAVVAQDFADGSNVVALVRRHGGTNRQIWILLLANGIAPVIGAFIGGAVQVSEGFLACYAGFFIGVLIFVSMHDIIPGSRERTTALKTFVFVTIGIVFMLLLRHFGG
jgi:ZIP family zinc transporter